MGIKQVLCALSPLHLLCTAFLVGYADVDSLNGEVAVACLKKAVSYFDNHTDYLKNVAAMIFPLLVVLPQVVAKLRCNICIFDKKLLYFDIVSSYLIVLYFPLSL